VAVPIVANLFLANFLCVGAFTSPSAAKLEPLIQRRRRLTGLIAGVFLSAFFVLSFLNLAKPAPKGGLLPFYGRKFSAVRRKESVMA